MSEYPPLTEEQQSQLEQLTYQQAMADWAAREAARQADLAKLAPLDGIDNAVLMAAMDAVEANDVGEEIAKRVGRVKQILRIDMTALMDLKAKLEIAEPEPEP